MGDTPSLHVALHTPFRRHGFALDFTEYFVVWSFSCRTLIRRQLRVPYVFSLQLVGNHAMICFGGAGILGTACMRPPLTWLAVLADSVVLSAFSMAQFGHIAACEDHLRPFWRTLIAVERPIWWLVANILFG